MTTLFVTFAKLTCFHICPSVWIIAHVFRKFLQNLFSIFVDTLCAFLNHSDKKKKFEWKCFCSFRYFISVFYYIFHTTVCFEICIRFQVTVIPKDLISVSIELYFAIFYEEKWKASSIIYIKLAYIPKSAFWHVSGQAHTSTAPHLSVISGGQWQIYLWSSSTSQTDWMFAMLLSEWWPFPGYSHFISSHEDGTMVYLTVKVLLGIQSYL